MYISRAVAMRLLLVVAIVGGVLVAPSVARANLLVNGSFEGSGPAGPKSVGSTDIPGWIVVQDEIDWTAGMWEHCAGDRSVDLYGSPGVGGIAQTFSTTPGQPYVVTFCFAGNPGGAPAIKEMRVQVDGGAQAQDFSFDTTETSFEDMGWVTESWWFTATQEDTTIEFLSYPPPPGDPEAFGPVIDNAAVYRSCCRPPCLAGDFDCDGDVDLEDFAALLLVFTGPMP